MSRLSLSGCTALFLLLLSCAAFSQPAKGPYLQSVTTTSIIVCWYTAEPVPTKLYYGETSDYGKTYNIPKPGTSHKAHITGLKPATEYRYRVITGEGDAGKDFTFKTAVPPGVPFTFAAFGDTRSNHEAHLSVVLQMRLTRPAFILHVGDAVAKGGRDSDWDEYFKVIGEKSWIGAAVPYYYALGNHEGNHANYYDYFELPRNNPEKTEQYYSFDYGDAHVICLNTETDFAPGSAQYSWLQGDLERSQSARWRIVFFHRPPYSSSKHGSSMKARNAFAPLFERYGVRLVFSGHDHNYERSVPVNGVTYIVSGAGGAPLYSPKGESWTAFKASEFGYCKIDVTEKALHGSFITHEGVTRDTFAIEAAPRDEK